MEYREPFSGRGVGSVEEECPGRKVEHAWWWEEPAAGSPLSMTAGETCSVVGWGDGHRLISDVSI